MATATLPELGDFGGFRRAFRQLFGFDADRVDYEEAVEMGPALAVGAIGGGLALLLIGNQGPGQAIYPCVGWLPGNPLNVGGRHAAGCGG